MSYPSRLVPSSKQKIIKKVNSKHYLCRWVDSSVEFKDIEGKLSTEAIDTERIFDLSTNKIPYSLREDILIKVLDEKYDKEWKEGVNGEIVPSDKYEIDSKRNYFFIKIGDIEGHKGYFPFPASSETHDYEFIVKIIHNPLVSNYYHCILNFDLFDSQGNNITLGKKSKSKKIIQSETRLVLINNAKFEI